VDLGEGVLAAGTGGAVAHRNGAAELAEEIRAYAREGISHVQIYPDRCIVAGIEAFAPVLEILDRE
jgi:hypothetical protein